MEKLRIKNLSIFVLITLVFCSISIIAKNTFIELFNNKDFGIFTIDYVKNYGAAFNILHTKTTFLIVISVLILLFTLFYIIKSINSFSKQDFAFSSMLCAGIICNLTERLIDGYVTDYIRLNTFAFPIFNLADLFICFGAFILICNILFNNEQNK